MAVAHGTQGGLGGDLVPVHGGLADLVDRIVPLKERTAFLAQAAKSPTVIVTKADLSAVYRLGDGALSPLEGPMNEEAWNRVLDEGVILSQGKRYAWGIPIAFPVTDAEANALTRGGQATLKSEEGEVVAIVEEVEVYAWDKPKYVKSVYGTDRFDHPGGQMVMQDTRTKLLGGKIRTLPQRKNRAYAQYLLSPRMVRAFIRDQKWERALAFQTRNPLHRAHEYALVCGAERLTREGFFTGVVLNPLVGELKGDDVPASVRMRCYQKLHQERLLGQGDQDESVWKKAGYDLNDVFELIALDIKMFYGGPKEAIMHAIYRQNFGFSHLVIGRKHADAPYADGTPIWGDFDAQEIFSKLPGELQIQPCKIGFAAYYESIGRVDLTENHPDEKPVSVSGSKIREQLTSGQKPDPRIMRPEIAEILIESYRAK